jgi:hypothetical protein
MRRVLALGVIGVVLATASGCGGPDGVMRDVIGGMNRLAEAIEKGESKERQEELAQKVRDATARFDKLKQTEEQKKALVDKHAAELEKASKRLKAALDGPNSKFDAPPLYR